MVAAPARVRAMEAERGRPAAGGGRVAAARARPYSPARSGGGPRHGVGHARRRLHTARDASLERSAAGAARGSVVIVILLILATAGSAPAAPSSTLFGVSLTDGKGGTPVPMQ